MKFLKLSNNSELLQKVVDTTLVGSGGGGILNPEQAERFIDYMVDLSVLVKTVRFVKMNTPSREIDRINIGIRKVRKATENVDDHVDADPTFSKIAMQTVKLRLDWSLTSESLEDNLEGDALEDHIARLMAAQFANDLEDLYINGDVVSGDPLLGALEGWYKRAKNGAHVVSAPALGDSSHRLDKSTFNVMIKAMPKKYMQQRSQLMFYTGTSPLQDWLNNLTDRSTPLGDAVIFGTPQGNGGGGLTNLRPFGLPITEVPLYGEALSGTYSGATGSTHTWVDLTFPQNRIVGVQREVKVYREFKPKKDAIEYTVYTRVCNQVENLDAWVFCKDVKVQ